MKKISLKADGSKHKGKFVAMDRDGNIVYEKDTLFEITYVVGTMQYQPYVVQVGTKTIAYTNATIAVANMT
jgi:hypothetical protein